MDLVTVIPNFTQISQIQDAQLIRCAFSMRREKIILILKFLIMKNEFKIFFPL